MDKDSDQIYVEHIVQAIVALQTFTRGVSFEQFAQDLKTQSAVARQLEIIGEASKRLSAEFKSELGALPWKKIAGMRDFLIHDYLAIDLREVWQAATVDIKEVKAALESRRNMAKS